MRIIRLTILTLTLAMPLNAQEQSPHVFLEALAARTPASTLKELRGDPEGFLEEAAGVVLGYGGPDGIGPSGLEDAVMAARALVRAREIRRMLQADLNNDLTIDAREIKVAIDTASATMRGRLLKWHLAADLSANGTLSWEELRAYAHTVSLHNMSEDRAAAIRALMVFDINSNGLLTVAELREAIALLGQAA